MVSEQIEVSGNSFRAATASYRERLIADLRGKPQGKAFSFWKLIALPLFLLLIATVVVRLADLDSSIQLAIYKAGGDSWGLGEHPFWLALYEFGPVPAMVAFGFAIIGLLLGGYQEKWRGWRRVFIFCALLLIVGPGIVTNGVLKEYWGRPRPREVEGMGGHSRFEPILTIDTRSSGKSFPCGHATMGFYFIGGYFLLRRQRRGMARFFLESSITFGTLIGIARMAKGGHFLSDVIWAFAVCYFVALGLYYALGLHNGLWRESAKSRNMPWWQRITMLFVSFAVVAAVLVASPYRGKRNYFPVKEASLTKPIDMQLVLTVGEHEIKSGESLAITGEAYGHGVPTSKISDLFWEGDTGETAQIVYKEEIGGWFSEVNEQLEFRVPWGQVESMKIQSSEADLWIALGDVKSSTELLLQSGEGMVTLLLQGRPLVIKGGSEIDIQGREKLTATAEDGDVLRLVIEDGFVGKIQLKD